MKNFIYSICFFVLLNSCKTEEKQTAYKNTEAPVAKKINKELVSHNDTRTDNYFWMRLSDEQKNAETPDAQTQNVLDYLNEENEYLSKVMRHTEKLQDKIYNEMVSRIKKDDASVPVSDNGYSYYTRFEKGGDYALYCRKKNEENATEEVMLNGPEMAKGFTYYGIGSQSVSPNTELIAFAIDTVSRLQYTIYFKDLKTGKLLDDTLSNTLGNTTWANDNKTVFYTTKDPSTLRANKIYKHVIGTNQSQDELVFEEKDEAFSCYLWKSKSKKFLFIGSYQTLSTEMQYLDADTPNSKWKVIQPRERDLDYIVDHYGDDFYIRTNLDATNFRLVKTPINKSTKENWVNVIPHRKDVFLQGFDLFKDFLVVEERKDGLGEIQVRKWDGEAYYIPFKDPSYKAYTTSNVDFNTNKLRYNYTSLTTPNTNYELNMDTKESTVLKVEEVLDPNFSSDNYISERKFATAKDGTKVPISIVYKKGIVKDGKNPLLLYAYGSYGASTDATFRSSELSLLDRGFVFAIAHIRGGQEMGRHWYEEGKSLKKKNTFTDFIDCGEFLIAKGYTNNDHLYALGYSAGGLLTGAILNMRPDLWNGVIAAVPFVDILTSMLDETIPLTTSEFDEWGNPKDEEYYDYMKSYSPYDNVEAKAYPNILITTGYWDSQVQYWEPAKWIAKLRALKTDDNLLIMDCKMENGHFGGSGRFGRYKETALMYSFLLDLEGITE